MSIHTLSGNNLKDQSAASSDTAIQLATEHSLQNLQVEWEGKHL